MHLKKRRKKEEEQNEINNGGRDTGLVDYSPDKDDWEQNESAQSCFHNFQTSIFN